MSWNRAWAILEAAERQRYCPECGKETSGGYCASCTSEWQDKEDRFRKSELGRFPGRKVPAAGKAPKKY